MEIKQVRMPLVPTFKVKLSNNISFTELKFAVRNAARDNSLYFKSIEFDSFEWDGDVDLSNFGRWLFGVKGFAGHWKNTPADEDGWVEVRLPDLQEARELIQKALDDIKVQGIVREIKPILTAKRS